MQNIDTGNKIKFVNSEETGISLMVSSRSVENFIEKYSISYDNEIKIESVTKDQITIGEKISKQDFFFRLIRDVQSTEEQTREFAAEILCHFLEFGISDFELETLKIGVEKIVNQIKVENNINVEQKLAEGLFEFIWHKKLSNKDEVELFERLTEIDKYYVWSYLGSEIMEDIKSYNSKKLNEYYSLNFKKWKERDIRLYGKEKMEEYYRKLKK